MQAREVAYHILIEVEKGAYANIALDEFLRKTKLLALDKAFITEIVYGSVKYQLKLDWIIGQLVKKEAKLETGPRIILRLALYQIMFMQRVPDSAATNEAVKHAKKLFHKGTVGLINAVLRNYLRTQENIKWPDREKEPLKFLEILYSHPVWMLERWIKRYGFTATEEICRFNNAPADLWIRTNTLKIDPQSLLERLEKEGCIVEKSRRVPEGLLLRQAPLLTSLPSFQKGLFTVQDESSMLVAHALKPASGHEVLDVCAGPGGKSTHLAQLMDNNGLIIACDIHTHRLKLIENNATRLGINIIKTVLQDATKISEEYYNRYSFILVDAPCSGLGVLRRRPDSRWRKRLEDITALATLQLNILENAIKCLKPGGRLIYSTCTIEPEENYEVINKIIKIYPEIKTFNLSTFLPYEITHEGERQELEQGMRQYLPFKDNMEGFFIAGLEKSC
ncbi:MAG: 16S rRNA (cytosine(967)-C(5))-methyltransferase RsmB [Firmicutes bacterium HGW-Firmicutes-12]|nr:MAG: 16S rRNA (cytosine(967)-C(5))-methyltransferase RsmB [Firmicutes bacterium HGW-Firmicutes-12]